MARSSVPGARGRLENAIRGRRANSRAAWNELLSRESNRQKEVLRADLVDRARVGRNGENDSVLSINVEQET